MEGGTSSQLKQNKSFQLLLPRGKFALEQERGKEMQNVTYSNSGAIGYDIETFY